MKVVFIKNSQKFLEFSSDQKLLTIKGKININLKAVANEYRMSQLQLHTAYICFFFFLGNSCAKNIYIKKILRKYIESFLLEYVYKKLRGGQGYHVL